MLQLTPQSRIFLAVQPVDFRKGIDGLAALCRQVLHDNPLGGAVYVFRNRTGTTLKLLAYDGQGFWLCTKRLSHQRFHWWPTATTPSVTLSAWELTGPSSRPSGGPSAMRAPAPPHNSTAARHWDWQTPGADGPAPPPDSLRH
jgi:transposase